MAKAVLFETSFVVNLERIALRLIREVAGLKMERELTEADGQLQTQVLCFLSLQELQNFFESDPYYETHRIRFQKAYDQARLHFGFGVDG
jgi:hypothetical protein